MSHFKQDMMGFVSLNDLHHDDKITDDKYKIEYLFNNEWKKVASVDYFKLFVDSDKLQRVCLLEKKKNVFQTNQDNQETAVTTELVETFIPLRMTVVLFDKVQEKWTLSYLTGPVLENVKENVEIKGWNGSEWLDFELEETTESETNQLIPNKSSFLVSLKDKKKRETQIMFLLQEKNKKNQIVCTCEWSMPSISNTRWVTNEILAPLAATSTVALVTSLLFPNTVKDVKSALAWSIPGWLLLDGTCIFQQVMNGTTAQLNPIQVKVRDPSFWIKAVATGMGPLLSAVQTSGLNSSKSSAAAAAADTPVLEWKRRSLR